MAKKHKREPKWDSRNLTRHYQNHPAGRDKECWLDLLSASRDVSEGQYEAASLDVFDDHWLEYEAEARDIAAGVWRTVHAYFVDDRLIVLCTDIDRDFIVTCYHDHWHSFNKHQESENRTVPIGRQRELYRRALRYAEQNGRIRRLNVIKDAHENA